MSAYEKLLNAQRSVEGVVKRGKNLEQKYSYAMAADVIAVARKALHDAGLVPAVGSVRTVEREVFTSGRGARALYVEVEVTLRITDPEDGQPLCFVASGAGADYGGGDKAVLKAQTAATKYAYANALALPFADHDPEKDVAGEPGRLPEQKVDPAEALPEKRVESIGKLLKASKIGFDELCLVLGSMGADRPKIQRRDSIRKAIGSLSTEQADQLENFLDAKKAGKA